ncbi:hypothetical protein M405DRAFT_826031 [Rhizopogon salebrosus TDB-379]|nr:hypothetical protein M405DRAFT_826031 [Rhizopogon salebrosus TDB-379]
MSLFSIVFSTSATPICVHAPHKLFVASSLPLPDLTTYGHSLGLSLSVSTHFRWIPLVYSKVSNFFRVGHGWCFSFTVEISTLLDTPTYA